VRLALVEAELAFQSSTAGANDAEARRHLRSALDRFGHFGRSVLGGILLGIRTRVSQQLLGDFQQRLRNQGFELEWPRTRPL
jgi:hypothetical protein